MIDFASIPKPHIATFNPKMPKRSSADTKKIIEKMIQIAKEGEKLREEYILAHPMNEINCRL